MEKLLKADQKSGRYSSLPHILVIDDDDSILDLVQDILSFDYSISTANNAQKGLELLKREHFDLLIVDLGLPGMSGTDLIQHLRAQPAYAKLPILVISAYTELAHRLEGLQVNAALSKPFSLSQLEHKVAELVRPVKSSTGHQGQSPISREYSLAC